ncbi:MAG TPA: sigma-70 family RNA polymerase sigma factor, partial [Candidatus Methylomirabilis sp.]|nr:sigma-70 family RNA polymerase sigma factor [Candidatus Methylomirabilis sp.]
MHEPDEALLTRLRAGDASAFEAVVRTYQRNLYRLAYRFTRNMEDAKDLAQEAFLRGYRALSRFDGRSSLYTWLYRITLNLCLNHRRGRRPEEAPDVGGLADPTPGALEALTEAERQAA